MTRKFDELRLIGIGRGESERGGYGMSGMGRRCIRRKSLESQRKSRQYDRENEEVNKIDER